MLTLKFASPLKSILCLGAHSDDLEIGCGGTLLHLMGEYPQAEVTWVVFSAAGQRHAEAQRSADLFLQRAGSSRVILKDFRDGFFPYDGGQIKDFFEQLKAEVSPDLVFTHTRHDLHQDHRLLCELAWNTWRDHLVLEYEIPKYDGDLGTPNVYIPLSPAERQEKLQHLLACFQTQANKHWFDEALFSGLMRLRGMECRAPSGYAEAFYGRKVILKSPPSKL
jgi:LmbE family N-acetylglucosaminyl deacetylase